MQSICMYKLYLKCYDILSLKSVFFYSELFMMLATITVSAYQISKQYSFDSYLVTWAYLSCGTVSMVSWKKSCMRSCTQLKQRSSKLAPVCRPQLAGFWKPGASTRTTEFIVLTFDDRDLYNSGKIINNKNVL